MLVPLATAIASFVSGKEGGGEGMSAVPGAGTEQPCYRRPGWPLHHIFIYMTAEPVPTWPAVSSNQDLNRQPPACEADA